MPRPAPTAWRRSPSYAWRRSPARTATATAPMGSCGSPTVSRPSTPRPSVISWLPSTSWPTASTRSWWPVTARTSWRRYIAAFCPAPCWRGVSASPRRCGRDAPTATLTSAATTPASFRPTTRTRWSRSWLQPDHRLAGVVAGEEGVEGVDGRLQPLVDLRPVLEFALRHPLPQLAGHLREPMPVVERQEPLHRRPAVDELEVVGRSGRTPVLVVDRDRAAQHHPGVHRQAVEHRTEDGPAHVVEVDVDPVRAQLLQSRVQVVGAVVDGAVEPQVVEEPPRLVVGPTDPDHAAAVDLGDLGGEGAGRPARRRSAASRAGRRPRGRAGTSRTASPPPARCRWRAPPRRSRPRAGSPRPWRARCGPWRRCRSSRPPAAPPHRRGRCAGRFPAVRRRPSSATPPDGGAAPRGDWSWRRGRWLSPAPQLDANWPGGRWVLTNRRGAPRRRAGVGDEPPTDPVRPVPATPAPRPRAPASAAARRRGRARAARDRTGRRTAHPARRRWRRAAGSAPPSPRRPTSRAPAKPIARRRGRSTACRARRSARRRRRARRARARRPVRRVGAPSGTTPAARRRGSRSTAPGRHRPRARRTPTAACCRPTVPGARGRAGGRRARAGPIETRTPAPCDAAGRRRSAPPAPMPRRTCGGLPPSPNRRR